MQTFVMLFARLIFYLCALSVFPWHGTGIVDLKGWDAVGTGLGARAARTVNRLINSRTGIQNQLKTHIFALLVFIILTTSFAN